MESGEQGTTSDPDAPNRLYELVQNETKPARAGNVAGLSAAVAFVVIAVVFVIALEAGIDIQQLLLGTFVVASVNLVAAVIWVSGARRER